MRESERQNQELLRELANKLATSAHQLSEAARRLQLAELTYREYLARLRKLDEQMRLLVNLLEGPKPDDSQPAEPTNPAFCEPPPPPQPSQRKLRYADYIEFSNYAELKKFEKMGGITNGDITACDPDELMRKLLEDPPA